jgi:hypothetical protein
MKGAWAARSSTRCATSRRWRIDRLSSRAEADARVGDGERMAAIVMPAGLSQAVLTDAGGQIEVITDPAREQTAGIVHRSGAGRHRAAADRRRGDARGAQRLQHRAG